MSLTTDSVENFVSLAGNGVKGTIQNKAVYGGNQAFISSQVSVDDKIIKTAENLAEDGKTPLFFADNEKLLGIIAVADVIKEDSPDAISELQNMGINVVMLTGDNEKTANAIGKLAGVDEIISGVMPDGKEKGHPSSSGQGQGRYGR